MYLTMTCQQFCRVILQGNQLFLYLSDSKLLMVVRTIIFSIACSISSGCTYNIAAQKTFDFSATYYMDGTCEVELPNRNRVFVTRGKYCSRFQKSTKRLPLVFSLIPRSHEEYGCANKVIGGLDVTSLNDNKVL